MKRSRKLLSLGHSYVVSVNRQLAYEMARAGGGAWEVIVAAPSFFHGGNDLRPNTLHPSPNESSLVPLSAYLTRYVHLFFYGRKLRALLREGWDLVHCWEEPYILAGGQVAWWTRPETPLVYRTAQSFNKHYIQPFNWIERYAMSRASGWICSGQTVAQALSQRPGYSGRPMRRIPLGVDLGRFYPDRASGEAVKASLGWDQGGAPVIGFVGRFVPEKGLDLLMRVLDGLKSQWRALFVGAGAMEKALTRWAARHEDRVRICTRVRHEEVPQYINAMDLLCAPSQTTRNWREQFGRMLIEAFACGVPVIGSDSGEIPYVIGDSGLVVGEHDEIGWQRTLCEILESPERCRELSGRGLDRARAHYAWPVIARQYLDFFEEVLAARGSAVRHQGGGVLL